MADTLLVLDIDFEVAHHHDTAVGPNALLTNVQSSMRNNTTPMAGYPFAKHQLTEVQIRSQKHTLVWLGGLQQYGIINTLQGFGGPQHITPLAPEPLDDAAMDILIGQKPHS
jgi:hypothetical protein